MPRTPLKSISSNITHRKELTPYTRGIIVGKSEEGATPTQIERDLNVPRTTIIDTLNHNSKRNNGAIKPRPGRPKTYTERQERIILKTARADPKLTYQELKIATGVTISHRTIYRILMNAGITKWMAKKRPKLRPVDAALRLKWALKHQDWTYSRWSNIIWSDECSVERGSGKRREWCFCTPAQKWNKEMIQATPKGKDIKVMVWAAFWGGGQSDLYGLDRDFESKKFGYSARSYIQVLDDNLRGIYNPDLTFMQDNAPIHKARSVIA